MKSFLQYSLILIIAITLFNIPAKSQLSFTKCDTLVSKLCDDEIISAANVKNMGAAAKTVLVKMVPVSMAQYHKVSFCWKDCYAPQDKEYTAPEPLTIGSNDESSAFHATLSNFDNDGNYVTGITKVKFIFWDVNNSEDQISYTATFDALPTGVAETTTYSYMISQPMPNPATDNVRFNYNISVPARTEIAIYNATGIKVKNVTMDDGNTVNINTSDLPSGVYYYEFKVNGVGREFNTLVIAR